MKSTINYAIIFTIASLGQCVAQEPGARWVDPAIELPGVWLYKGDDGAEPYSFRMDLNDTCHAHLADYAGVWIDKDTRPEGYRVGCGYAFQDNDCAGTFNSFELDFSGSEDTTVSFQDVKIGYVGESFQFSKAPCAGGGVVLRENTEIVVPTQ